MNSSEALERVTAIILAGGMGQRLRAVVSDRPKVLAQVGGRPFLSYLLEHFADAGVHRAVICTGYLAEQVAEEFGDRYKGMSLGYSQEDEPLGTGGALRLALEALPSDLVLVANGDSFCSSPLGDFLAFHQQHGAAGSILLTQVEDQSRYGSVALDEDDAIIRFLEKGGPPGPGWINAGVYLLSRELLKTLPPQGAVSLERQVFPNWIGHGLYGYRGQGRFIDIGTPQSYAAAQEFFARRPPLPG